MITHPERMGDRSSEGEGDTCKSDREVERAARHETRRIPEPLGLRLKHPAWKELDFAAVLRCGLDILSSTSEGTMPQSVFFFTFFCTMLG